MFRKLQSDNKHIFVNNIKLDKKKESKTTPHVNVKISAYDKVVQLITNDNKEVKPPQEEAKTKSTYECLNKHFVLCFKFNGE